jgi:hypothetical protein
MGVRAWLILAGLALGRIGFGYQYQTAPTLDPDLVRLFHRRSAVHEAMLARA